MSHNHCDQGSCGHGHGGHGYHGHNHGRCHCCHGQCCCYCHDESCDHDHHEKGEFACELLELADQAWMELLKEKIKEQILASGGGHLDQLAKLVAESNRQRWQHKMASKTLCEEYKEKLCSLFKSK